MTLQAQIIAVVAIILFSFTGGFEVASWKMKAAQLAEVTRMEAAYKALQLKTADESAKLNADNAKLKANARTSTTRLRTDIAKNPSLAKCALGAAIVRDWNGVP